MGAHANRLEAFRLLPRLWNEHLNNSENEETLRANLGTICTDHNVRLAPNRSITAAATWLKALMTTVQMKRLHASRASLIFVCNCGGGLQCEANELIEWCDPARTPPYAWMEPPTDANMTAAEATTGESYEHTPVGAMAGRKRSSEERGQEEERSDRPSPVEMPGYGKKPREHRGKGDGKGKGRGKGTSDGRGKGTGKGRGKGKGGGKGAQHQGARPYAFGHTAWGGGASSSERGAREQ